MLTHTFLHIKGVGRQIERMLWAAGVTSWQDLKTCRKHIRGIGAKKRAAILKALAFSERRLSAGDARFFHDRLPAAERWRIAHDFKRRLAFLDIETTGVGAWAETTLVGVYAAGEARLFVRDLNLAEARGFLEAHDVWVSYNGLTFDEPFLRREFGESIRPAAHIDLRYCLRAVGLKGGLKGVERSIGIERPDHLAHLDGWDAVRLWGEYRAGSAASLKTLVEYNMEDVVNLGPLLEIAAARHVEERGLPMEPFSTDSTPASREKARAEAVREIGEATTDEHR